MLFTLDSDNESSQNTSFSELNNSDAGSNNEDDDGEMARSGSGSNSETDEGATFIFVIICLLSL